MRTKFCFVIIPAALLCGSIGVAKRAAAEDRELAFVHALEDKKYADTAVDYLTIAKQRPDISPELKDVWLLEMSKCMRITSQFEQDPVQKEKQAAEALKYLDQFAKEKPNHPAALEAGLANAAMIMDQGMESLAASRTAADEKEKQAKLVAARKLLQQAAPLFRQGVEKLEARITKLPPLPKGPTFTPKQKDQLKERKRLEVESAKMAGELGLINYKIAETFPAPADIEARKTALNDAYKDLDKIYQNLRDKDPNEPDGWLALNAHAWTGKVAEELGDLKAAKDIYEEVLENFQEPDKDSAKFVYARTNADDILTRTKHFYIMLMLKDTNEAKNYEARARDFLGNEQYRKVLKNEWGFQAASFEFAKFLWAKAEKETKPEIKRDLTKEVLKTVTEMAGIRSEFQRDAIALRRKITGSGAQDAQTESEATMLAREAVDKKDWTTAAKWYGKAIEFAEKDKTADLKKERPGRIAQYQEAMAACEFQPIVEQFNAERLKPDTSPEKFNAWYDSFMKVASENKKTGVAKDAAALAVNSMAILYSTLADKMNKTSDKKAREALQPQRDAAGKKLQESVDYVLANYPKTSAADEARMGLAQALFFADPEQNRDQAISLFESISPTFERYAKALQEAGKLRYNRYFNEKKKPEDKRNAKQMDEDLAKAKDEFQEAIKALIAQLKPKEVLPPAIIEAKLLLAQLSLELKDFPGVTTTLQDLIGAIDRKNPPELDQTMLQVFQLAMRGYMGQNDYKKAGEAGDVLIAIGPDNAQINSTLVGFVVGLDKERKRIQDELNGLPDSAPPSQTEPLRATLGSIKDMMSKMLTALSQREKLPPQSTVFIGQLFSDMDETEKAKDQFKMFLDRVKDDEAYRKAAATLVTKVRAKQIDLLRKSGNLVEAAQQAEDQCKENPRALDFLMLRAQIYQTWGAKDPTKYDKAVSQWTEIRVGLQKTKPPQYYDAIYNAAVCLRDQGKKLITGNKTEARKKLDTAGKVLNSEFQLSPKLNNDADNIKRFTDLKKDLDKLRSALPAPVVAAPEPSPEDKGA